MNGKHEEGAVKGLREDCTCSIAKIIICNYLPMETRIAVLTEDEEHKKGGSQRQRKVLSSHLCSFRAIEKLLCNEKNNSNSLFFLFFTFTVFR